MLKKFFAVLFVLLSASVLWAGGSAIEKDTLIVGTSAGYPPFEFRDRDGSIAGFDFEMMNALGEILGKKIQWQDMVFEGLIPSLLTGKIDVIAAGVTATEERRKKVDFSDDYYLSLSGVLTQKDKGILSVADLSGSIVAVQLGTVQEVYARTLPDVTVKSFQKFEDCVREVAFGRADATMMDLVAAQRYASLPDYKDVLAVALEVEMKDSTCGLALSQKDPELKAALNEALNKLRKSGKLDELKKKWFN